MDLKNEVDRASKESNWPKTVSWPAFLGNLQRTFSRGYIMSHEREIKDYLNDYGVYYGHYSFAEHFGKRAKHGSIRGRPGSDTASATSSSHGELSDHSASHSLRAKNVAGRSKSSSGKSNLPTPTNSFTSRTAKQKEIFGMGQHSPYKPASTWCIPYARWDPAVVFESGSEYSWISKRKVKKLHGDVKCPEGYGRVSETIGHLRLQSEEIVYVLWQPHDCPQSLITIFHVASGDDFEMIIGKDDMIKVRGYREAGKSLLAMEQLHDATDGAIGQHFRSRLVEVNSFPQSGEAGPSNQGQPSTSGSSATSGGDTGVKNKIVVVVETQANAHKQFAASKPFW